MFTKEVGTSYHTFSGFRVFRKMERVFQPTQCLITVLNVCIHFLGSFIGYTGKLHLKALKSKLILKK